MFASRQTALLFSASKTKPTRFTRTTPTPSGLLSRSGTSATGILLLRSRVPAEVVAGFYFYHAGEFYTTEANLTALAKARAPELASLVFVKMAETEQLDDATLTEHAEQFSEWAYPVAYAVKAICSYKGKLYRCVQAHSSQADWTPPATASLWKEIGDPTVEYPEWSQPLGAHDAYALGDKVAKVKVSSVLKNHPVCLSSEGEVSIEMEKVLSQMPNAEPGMVKANKILEVNAEHPIYAKLKAAFEADKDSVADYAEVLYQSARLVAGLPVEDASGLTDKLFALLAK